MKTTATFALLILMGFSLKAAGFSGENPSKNSAKTSTEASQQVVLSLTNAKGKVVMQDEVTANQSNVIVKISQDLPAGMYLLKVKASSQAETQGLSIKVTNK